MAQQDFTTEEFSCACQDVLDQVRLEWVATSGCDSGGSSNSSSFKIELSLVVGRLYANEQDGVRSSASDDNL